MTPQKDNATTLAALLRRRDEVQAWLDGPVKKATLTAIERQIGEHLSEDKLATG